MGPAERRLHLVEQLAAVDIAATVDPASLNPPDTPVLVEAVNATGLVTLCCWNASVTVWLCAPASGAALALAQLEALVTVVAGAIGATQWEHTIRTHGDTSWPAYRLTVPTTVTR